MCTVQYVFDEIFNTNTCTFVADDKVTLHGHVESITESVHRRNVGLL